MYFVLLGAIKSAGSLLRRSVFHRRRGRGRWFGSGFRRRSRSIGRRSAGSGSRFFCRFHPDDALCFRFGCCLVCIVGSIDFDFSALRQYHIFSRGAGFGMTFGWLWHPCRWSMPKDFKGDLSFTPSAQVRQFCRAGASFQDCIPRCRNGFGRALLPRQQCFFQGSCIRFFLSYGSR